ncbi:DUF6191 domain-containing protein [Isoptericola sp. 4D.3]|uniref:DUF6191 domain-containing protein n=1 Tax=Isoptericola peretonis TaxID=2918523 RepID=A0ABT0J0G9_9MICO|nr:DUF6191 domain-containing protein [Isoptericola sp. 4D.3]
MFQPSRAHLTAEKERQRLDIVQTPAEGAPFGVDLEAGIAYLDAGGPPAPATASSTAEANVPPSAGVWPAPSIVHSSTREPSAQPEAEATDVSAPGTSVSRSSGPPRGSGPSSQRSSRDQAATESSAEG